MYEIFLKTLPFFALIGVGYMSGVTFFHRRRRPPCLTKFVFYFALSAMLFRFSSNLSLGDLFDWNFVSLPAGISCRLCTGRVGCALSSCRNNRGRD